MQHAHHQHWSGSPTAHAATAGPDGYSQRPYFHPVQSHSAVGPGPTPAAALRPQLRGRGHAGHTSHLGSAAWYDAKPHAHAGTIQFHEHDTAQCHVSWLPNAPTHDEQWLPRQSPLHESASSVPHADADGHDGRAGLPAAAYAAQSPWQHDVHWSLPSQLCWCTKTVTLHEQMSSRELKKETWCQR